MLGLIGNLSLQELLLIAALAVLLFGRRLPQVVGQLFGQLQRMRRALDDLRRETGIDRELQTIERSFRDVSREARIEDPLRAPAEPRTPRTTPTPPPGLPKASGGAATTSTPDAPAPSPPGGPSEASDEAGGDQSR